MIIVANWKGNIPSSLGTYLDKMDRYKHKFILSPPFTHIQKIHKRGYIVSSQNVSIQNNTSDIPIQILKNIDIQYCIVGHSECLLHETRADIYAKIELLISNNITPILCTNGDSLELDMDICMNYPNIILAYEPIEFIGTGKTIERDNLQQIVKEIKTQISNTILYGGSIDDQNFIQFLDIVDGFMIGKASLDQTKMENILQHIYK